MSINVSCPSCGRPYTVKDDAAGKRFKCKDCESVVEVPVASGNSGDDEFGDPYDTSGFDDDASGIPAPVTGRRRISPPTSGASPDLKSKTLWPAVCMYVVIALSILNGLWNLASLAMGPQEVPQVDDPQVQEFLNRMFEQSKVTGPVFAVLYLFRDIFLIFAFSRLQSMNMWGVAMAGAIISVIPCIGSPCCICGVPFGIWALVVLNDPAVKAAFR